MNGHDQRPERIPQPMSGDGLPRAVVVAGAVGGAGATTLAILLAAVLSHEKLRKVLVLDVTPAGGDLAARIFGAGRPPGPSWDDWVRSGADPALPAGKLAGADAGVVVLPTTRAVPDTSELLQTAIDALTPDGWVVVVDAGSGAPWAEGLMNSIQLDAALVLTIPQRADGANRARWFFTELAARHGRDVLADAVVAVSDHDGSAAHVFGMLSAGLANTVSQTVLIPADRTLATGLTITPSGIGDATRAAVQKLLVALSDTTAATREPAR